VFQKWRANIEDNKMPSVTGKLHSSVCYNSSKLERKHTSASKDLGWAYHAIAEVAVVPLPRRTGRSPTLHHPRLSCANSWAATAALHRESQEGRPRVHCQGRRVRDGRGRTGSRIQPAGIYEPVPGLLDTLFVPKVAGNQGTRFEKSLVISSCQDGCMASPSWAHSRFASGYGPNRQEALFDSERMHAPVGSIFI
jgi:hypothetical protein